MSVRFEVNGEEVEVEVEPRMTLADCLRHELRLTGTHLGCEHGVCGACTVLLDGAPARSCITYAVACEGAEVTTIEGLDEDEVTIELRSAFTREHALQCGYCTPGMLVSARDLVLRLPDADEQLIRVGLSGNLCRCTGYVGIVQAVQSVIDLRRARNIAPESDGGRKTLGPVGSGHKQHGNVDGASRIRPAESGQKLPDAVGAIDTIPDFTPATVLEQSFDVSHPTEQVFAMFDDIAAVAACLPGASLTSPPTPRRVEGAIRVKIGPIAATFLGAARVERNPVDMSGRIVGIGNDRRSRSSTQGEIRYRLVPIADGAGTRVDLSIGYTLAGMLAQVGRPGLVRDLAARLIAEFSKNLDRRLAGLSPDDTTAASGELSGMSLVFGVLRERAARWFGRFSGR
jgi:aerobic carbon-monoxide dehydrogenase small subunit